MSLNQSLGDYQLLELIGKGGQGQVYKALDTKLKRVVAIKVFHPGDDDRRRKLASFKHEARLGSALNHPNRCTVYALFENENDTYLVMEYIEGKLMPFNENIVNRNLVNSRCRTEFFRINQS